MNEYADFEENTTEEIAYLVIKATRAWVHAIMASACSSARCWHLRIWDETFDAVGSTEASHVWSSFMRHLSLEGNAKFKLGCGSCGVASQDEQALMQCLAAHQKGRKTEALAILDQWFSGDCLWKADALAEAFADHLTVKRLCLPYSVDVISPAEMPVVNEVLKHAIH
jgi:hypothetical protein